MNQNLFDIDLKQRPSGLWVPESPYIITPSKTIPWRMPAERNPLGGTDIGWPIWQAAVGLGNTNTASRVAGGAVTGSKTVTAGSNLCAVLWLAFDNASGLSVTVGAVAGATSMNSIGTQSATTGGGDSFYCAAYVLTAGQGLGTGSITFTATVAGGVVRDVYWNVVVYTGVDQTTPIRAASYQNVVATALSVSVPNQNGDMTVGVYKGGGNGVQSLSGNNTPNGDGNNSQGSTGAASDHIAGTGSNNVHSFTSASANTTCLLGFALAAVATATYGPPNRLAMRRTLPPRRRYF